VVQDQRVWRQTADCLVDSPFPFGGGDIFSAFGGKAILDCRDSRRTFDLSGTGINQLCLCEATTMSSLMQIFVRVARPEDEKELAIIDRQATDLLRQTYRPTQAGYANKSRISRNLKRLVAVVEGKCVGTTQYYIEVGIIRISGLAVHAAYRRRGVAHGLISHVVDLAIKQSCRAVRLSTIKETGNDSIFERLGFEIIGENMDALCEGVNGQKVTDIEMEHRIFDPIY
jgi:ribosomal protein S18 acetylase RimI-like enzyme